MPKGRPLGSNNIIRIPVQGMIYECPITPELSTIKGYNLPKKDQYWRRDTTHEQWEWNTDPSKGRLWIETASDEQKQWFEEEIERLHRGMWLMINGEPVYFNKYCYFFHQWFMLLIPRVRPEFKETSLEYFRFFELCEKDQYTLGDCGIKGRRVGLSSMSASIKVLIGILESNTLSGIVSKTGTDAYEMYLMVKNGLENLPDFLMPDLNKVTESELHIAKQTKRITANNNKASADKGKDNRINWLDTSDTAYDGRAVRHVTIDEAGKWKRSNVKTCLSKISDTLIQGARIIGKVSIFSTVDKGDQGGDNFREIWEGSDHINGNKDVYGRTKTKLRRFFIPAFRGYLGYVGRFGESIIENPTKDQIRWLQTHEYLNPITGDMEKCPDPFIGAKQWLQVTRDMLADDPEELQEEKRKNPFEWQEVFKGANNKCNFELDDLNEQIKEVEDYLRTIKQKENGRRGKFIKKDTGEKVFLDDNAGMWYILDFVTDNNKSEYKGSIKCPNNTIYGAAGLDTFANAKHTVEKGSDACCIIQKRYDALNPDTSGMPVAMFVGRPTIKDDFHDQIFWGLEYYGIKLLAERAPTDWEDYAIKKKLAAPLDFEKLYGYLIPTKRWNASDVYGIAPQNKEAREQHLTEMIEYAKFNMKKIKFIRLLREMVNFDINDRTDYDACMAWGYALMGLKEWKGTDKVDVKPRKFMQIKKSKQYH